MPTKHQPVNHDDPDGARRSFRVRSIGVVCRLDGGVDAPDAFCDPAVERALEIDGRWCDGLAGLEEYSHLVVLFWLDRAERPRTAGPPRPAEGRMALPPVGLFATRTPRRPNPIGLACPRLLRREGDRLIVVGLDAWDGTPVLDLKGYSPRDELHPEATVPRWLTDLWAEHDRSRCAHR